MHLGYGEEVKQVGLLEVTLKQLEDFPGVQWLRICCQRGDSQSLVWEDPTGCRETKPIHNC